MSYGLMIHSQSVLIPIVAFYYELVLYKYEL